MQTTQGGTDKLTPAQVASIVGVSKATILREIEAGEFEAFRVGPTQTRIRVTRASVEAYLARRTIAAPSAPAPLAA